LWQLSFMPTQHQFLPKLPGAVSFGWVMETIFRQ